MKVERQKQFSPITITLESVDDLKWMLSIADSSITQARKGCENIGIKLGENPAIQQMALWDQLKNFVDEVKK